MQQVQLFRLDGPLAGLDEAGWPLAGPVVAADVIFLDERRSIEPRSAEASRQRILPRRAHPV